MSRVDSVVHNLIGTIYSSEFADVIVEAVVTGGFDDLKIQMILDNKFQVQLRSRMSVKDMLLSK